ncbi:MAG: hypothetical protein IKR45_00610 [Treponema sp.]|nr:hypothetical protein [Treponema sp.]
MKKVLFVLLIFSVVLISSCSKNKTAVIEETQPESEPKQEPTPKIDYDLTNMGYNMLSGITFEMLIEPEKYVDKTVKISGQFYTEVEEGIRYYSVIVWDATLCCPAGMDFIPPETMQFPDDFPAAETQITVTGILRENVEDGNLLFYANKVEF